MFQYNEVVEQYKTDVTRIQKNSSFSKLNLKKEIELGKKIKSTTGSNRQRHIEQLITPHLPYVIDLAIKMYQSRKTTPIVTEEDFISWGNEGILKAATTYDYKKGYRFLTHAKNWIEQSIRQNYADNKKTIYYPTAHYQQEHKQKKVTEAYYNIHGCKPPQGEKIEYINKLGNSEIITVESSKILPHELSMNEIVYNEESNGKEASAFISDDSYDENIIVEQLTNVSFIDNVKSLIKSDKFTYKERYVFLKMNLEDIKLGTLVQNIDFIERFGQSKCKDETFKKLIIKRNNLIKNSDNINLVQLFNSSEWIETINRLGGLSSVFKKISTDKVRSENESAKTKIRILSKIYLSEYRV